MRLITIPMSHYCEKARWGLAHAGLEYIEEPHLQVFHYLAVRRRARGSTVPVLVADGEVVEDSTAILQFLDQHYIPERRRLYPDAQRNEIEELEERFDTMLGLETRRWVYFRWIDQPTREVLRVAAQGTPWWERLLAPLLFPLMRRFLAMRLRATRENVEAGLLTIATIFDEVGARLADGRPYLMGTEFTAADLTFACMAAPILLPPEYGVLLPTLEEAPAEARAEVEKFRLHPAGQFVLRLYRQRRAEMGI